MRIEPIPYQLVQGAKDLAAGLVNLSLRTLLLDGCCVDTEAVVLLAQAIKTQQETGDGWGREGQRKGKKNRGIAKS